MYKQDICLMNVRPVTDAYVIECIKVQNMTEKARLTETIIPGVVNIQQTRLIPFLQGQQIISHVMEEVSSQAQAIVK